MIRIAKFKFVVFLSLLGACGDDIPPPPSETVFVQLPDGAAKGCNDGGCPDGGAPSASVCGDGLVQVGLETCDDGNTLSGDGCSATCQQELCGNGRIDMGEECEPPKTASCTASCLNALSTCGNTTVEAAEGEQCDDGNQTRGDGCHECRFECGDGVLDREIGEECEPRFTPKDGNGVSTTCTDICRRKPFCGDSKVNPESGEECDPVNGITCVSNCKRAARADAGVEGCQSASGDAGAQSDQNLVPNGTFSANLDGWTVASGAVTATHLTAGGNNEGSVEVGFKASAVAPWSVDGLVRCVAVTAGSYYELQAQYFNLAEQPTGAKAFPVILLYPNANCSGKSLPSGPASDAPSAETGRWIPYRFVVDATQAGPDQARVSIAIKLGVVVRAGQSAKARWDDVSLREIDPRAIDPKCGNCVVDKGEGCDDGNHLRGDGCDPRCRLEKDCGNGVVDPGEQCDQFAEKFTDANTCTPMCTQKTGCDDCAIAQCRPQVDACLGLEGLASAGSGLGQPKALLCERLRKCVQQSGCDGATAISTRQTLAGMPGVFMENCYCGTAGQSCLTPGQANGSCRAEVEAALESSDPVILLQRVGGAQANYPIFASLRELRLCEATSCGAACSSQMACGDGVVQERTAEFAATAKLSIAGKQEPCVDGLTPSGKGCSFEECDGTMMCDENCFVLGCGNGIRQTGEACDDGNLVPGDGCDANCGAEYTCGDGVVASNFGEQCDPPKAGPVCSMAEFTANPTSCGCGSTCAYKVCGNGIVQEGEQCDPPNGSTCGNDCQLAGLGECIECMKLVEGECGEALLVGIADIPGLETGCLNDKACFDLLRCQVDSRCGLKAAPRECYCGLESADIEDCDQPTFVPKGPCKDQMIAAYSSQWGMSPVSNMELLDRYSNIETGAGLPASMFVANTLVDCNIYQRSGLALGLRASGADEATVARCVTACGSN